MVKNTSINLDVTRNVDGFTIAGGSTDVMSVQATAATNGDSVELLSGFTGASTLTLPNAASGTLALLADLPSGSISWNETSVGLTMAPNNGYMYDGIGAASFALPATAAQFSVLALLVQTAGVATITQGSGQNIQLGSSVTTVGAGGSLASTLSGDALYLLCVIADTKWVALNSIGSFTVV